MLFGMKHSVAGALYLVERNKKGIERTERELRIESIEAV
jgi:hypothetical protein